MGSAFEGSPLHLGVVDLKADPIDLHTGVFLPKTPVVFQYQSGRYLRDCLGSTFVSLELYSDRIIQLFTERGFTGWRIYPVRVLDKRKREVHGYHGVAVRGRCGEIDGSRSERVVRPPRIGRGQPIATLRGMYIKDDYWDGSDVFCPSHSRATFVTERVKKALESIKATNISFVSLADFETYDLSKA
jgi:hypothetical protein